ncbi:MAG: helix-turn-helix transcriptional regulator [Clostridia bacterium]|nr:helix-turn-helix transcriptional regulator [Clostridia bacterium]
MISFRERFKELRLENNVTQQEMGKLLGVSKMAISHWESGHSEPSIEQLIYIAKYFSVSLDYLLGVQDT